MIFRIINGENVFLEIAEQYDRVEFANKVAYGLAMMAGAYSNYNTFGPSFQQGGGFDPNSPWDMYEATGGMTTKPTLVTQVIFGIAVMVMLFPMMSLTVHVLIVD